ncbi:MAG: hypothetical protein OIF48_14310 [Silicimonas sp.]|nr:hypothetical protein [Silicimonas sp.]
MGYDVKAFVLCSTLASAMFFSLATTALANQDRVFRIAIHEGNHDERLKYSSVPKPGYDTHIDVDRCPALDDPILKDTLRVNMELMFICHALRRGDIADRIEFVVVPNPARALRVLQKGQADAYASSLPRNTLTEEFSDLLISDPALKDDQFFVGLFTTDNREDVLSVSSSDEIRELRGLAVESWTSDVVAMNNLQLAEVITIAHYHKLAEMIEKGRADITFANLEKESVTWGEKSMRRLDGYRVNLPFTRHMVFASNQQDAFRHMQSFIHESRAMEPDPILQAYHQSSFLSADYDDWEILGPVGSASARN